MRAEVFSDLSLTQADGYRQACRIALHDDAVAEPLLPSGVRAQLLSDLAALTNIARHTEFTFAAQPPGVRRLQAAEIDQSIKLPLACDPRIHGRRSVSMQFDLEPLFDCQTDGVVLVITD